MRSILFSLVFGTLVSLVAAGFGMTGGSTIQAVLLGLMSAMGIYTVKQIARGRVRRSQGEAPALNAGETALLYGPVEVKDSTGSVKSWAYVSNQRLMLRSEDGDAADIALSDIEELRPAKQSWFSGELKLVSKKRGLLTLMVPDAARWHSTLSQAIHSR